MKSILLLCLLHFHWSTAHIYNTTTTDFSKCKVHYSIQEKTYKVFYDIIDQNQTRNDNATLLDFHFSVLTSSDAHILLAPSSSVTFSDPVYEIVIGAGGNTFSDIRRKQKSDVRASIRLKGLLSAVDVRSFWIHVLKDGTIDVGKEGKELAFISWRDPDPLPLKVFSFSTWGNVEAKWLFDCPRANETTNSEIELVLTDLERLRRDLLTGYDPFVRPVLDEDAYTDVGFRFFSNFISLDEKNSILNVKGKLLMDWKDEKLVWDPADYDGIEYMHAYHGEVWKPDVVIMNAVTVRDADTFNTRLLVISSNGTVRWKTSLDSNTFCDLSNLMHWPNDAHSCELEVTFERHIDKHHLVIHDDGNKVERENFNNGWKIQSVSVFEYYGSSWLNATSFDPPGLKIQIDILRISDLYGKAVFTPYIVTSTLMLLSFWASPFGYLKITLASLQLLLVNMMLIGIAMSLPGHPKEVPFLVHLYSSSVLGNIVAVLIAVVVINLSRREKLYGPPHCLTKLLGCKAIEMMLLLPNGEVGNIYGKLDKQVSLGKPSVQEMWVRVGTAVDRVAFFVFLCLTTTAFFMKY